MSCSCPSRSGARRDGVRVRAPGGPDLGRLRRRLAVHGPLRAAAPGARLDRRVADRDGHRRGPVRPVDHRSRSRSSLVTLSGFLQPPSSVSRSVLLQRNTPREIRGRVFSAFYVMRDVIFLIGMAGAGLADVVDIRLLIVVASCLLFVSAAVHARRARPGRRDLGRARAARPPRAGAGAVAAATPLAPGDARRLRPAGRAPDGVRPARRREQRDEFIAAATVREVPAGTRDRRARRRRRSSAYFILDGSATAGVPEPDGGYRGLSTMGAGDFFGEIAALTGSTRTATSSPTSTRRCSRSRPTAAGHDGRSRDPALVLLDADRRGSIAPRPPTCRASPASTRTPCATCGRRDPTARRCRGRLAERLGVCR